MRLVREAAAGAPARSVERAVRYAIISAESIKNPASVTNNRSVDPACQFPSSAAVPGDSFMSIDDIKKRFVNEIKLRGYDDKYIDKNEEREILQIAIHLGVNIDSARIALLQVCEENGYLVETRIIKVIKDQIDTAIGNDGMVDREEFDRIFQDTRKQVEGKKNDREVKKLIVTVMEDTGNNRVKRGWFSDWYAALKRDLGME
jgi:hypothetical protein